MKRQITKREHSRDSVQGGIQKNRSFQDQNNVKNTGMYSSSNVQLTRKHTNEAPKRPSSSQEVHGGTRPISSCPPPKKQRNSLDGSQSATTTSKNESDADAYARCPIPHTSAESIPITSKPFLYSSHSSNTLSFSQHIAPSTRNISHKMISANHLKSFTRNIDNFPKVSSSEKSFIDSNLSHKMDDEPKSIGKLLDDRNENSKLNAKIISNHRDNSSSDMNDHSLSIDDDESVYGGDSYYDGGSYDEINYENLDEYEDFDHSSVVPVVNGSGTSNFEFFGLPIECKRLFMKYRNVQHLYQWQKDVLSMSDVLYQGKNLVYSLPTSGGKTLVAEIMLLKTVQVNRRKAIFVLPYVSLVEEKMRALQLFSDELDFAVEAYFSNRGIMPVPPDNTLCIATIEKSNAILNSLIEEKRLDEVGCIVIDELHMLGDSTERGQILESMLTKIRFLSKLHSYNIQIIGMSATIPNLQEIATWLDAALYISDFRPVQLSQYIKIGKQIYDCDMNLVRTLPIHENNKHDPEDLISICREVIPDHSALFFCASKKSCEYVALDLAKLLPKDLTMVKKEEKLKLLNNLRASSNSLDRILSQTIPFGIAYHHSGLTREERSLIEEAYRSRVLCLITATSTLAAGVNLPAKRVIFRTPYIGRDFLTKSRYLQMAGRAGRAGIDLVGESFLLLDKNNKVEQEKGIKLVKQPLDPVISQLSILGIQRLALELVCSGIVDSCEKLKTFALGTFYSFQTQQNKSCSQESKCPGSGTKGEMGKEQIEQRSKIEDIFMNALEFLIDNKFIVRISEEEKRKKGKESCGPFTKVSEPSEEIQEETSMFDPTPFGMATFKSAFSIQESAFISKEIQRSQEQGIILLDELHLCYLVTPVGNVLLEPDWRRYFNIFSSLSSIRERISQLINLPHGILTSRASNNYKRSFSNSNQEDQEGEIIAKRFYNALILSDLINECTLDSVALKFGVDSRGGIQNLMASAAMFCSMMASFCDRMGWWALGSILRPLSQRLCTGSKPDILEITDIDCISSRQARILYNAGYKDIKSIAQASLQDLVLHLQPKLGPFVERNATQILEDAKRYISKKARYSRKMLDELDSIVD